MIAVLQQNVPQRVKDAILAMDPCAEVILFGSRARGDADSDSDWDFMVLHDKPIAWKDEEQYIHKLFDLELDLDAVVSVRHWSKSQWNSDLYRAMPLHQNIEREGVWL